MSALHNPTSDKPSFRELNMEELDTIVGGAGLVAPDPHQFDKVAGFDTSQLHLDAAAMTSGKAEAEIAHAVQTGQTTTAQGMHLLEAVAASDHTSVTQALSSFAGQVSALPGHGNDAYAVGAEIAHLITTNQVTAHQAVADVGDAVGAHALTSEQAMTLLTGVARNGDAALQAAVGGQIGALINAHQITADAALAEIGMSVAGHSLSGSQAVMVLAGMAGHGDAALQTSIGGEIAELIHSSQLSDRPDGRTEALRPQAVTSAIDHAVASHTLTGDQALTLLVGISAGGNGSVQTVAHAGGGASARNDVQTVVHEEISALVHHKALTLDHAFEVLAGLPTGGSSNLQHAIGGAMCALMMDERTNKLEGNVDHAISVLAGIAARGDANFQIALGEEMAGLISALRSQHAALEVMGAIDHAVASQNLTAGQAIMLFAGIAVHGDSQLESAAGRGIAMLIANHQMTSVEAQADIDKAVTAHILTPVQAETLWRACNPHAGFDIALNRAV